ncbi:MAG: hypothetical protein QW830_06260 [Nitrososphaerales archaeon]
MSLGCACDGANAVVKVSLVEDIKSTMLPNHYQCGGWDLNLINDAESICG